MPKYLPPDSLKKKILSKLTERKKARKPKIVKMQAPAESNVIPNEKKVESANDFSWPPIDNFPAEKEDFPEGNHLEFFKLNDQSNGI